MPSSTIRKRKRTGLGDTLVFEDEVEPPVEMDPSKSSKSLLRLCTSLVIVVRSKYYQVDLFQTGLDPTTAVRTIKSFLPIIAALAIAELKLKPISYSYSTYTRYDVEQSPDWEFGRSSNDICYY